MNLREVVALLLGSVADDGVHVFLGCDHHPCTPVGLDGKIFSNGLQGQHELPVLTDKLTDLVHQKEDAAIRFLLRQPRIHVVGEIADRHRVCVLIPLNDAVLDGLVRHRGIGFADFVIPQHGLITALTP